MKLPPMIMCLLALLVFTDPVAAHTEMTSSNIKQGDVLTDAPSVFECSFSGQVRLVSLILKKKEGAVIPLEFTKPKSAQKTFSVPLPELGPAEYVIEWRIIARDGHVLSGTIEFKLTEPGQ